MVYQKVIPQQQSLHNAMGNIFLNFQKSKHRELVLILFQMLSKLHQKNYLGVKFYFG